METDVSSRVAGRAMREPADWRRAPSPVPDVAIRPLLLFLVAANLAGAGLKEGGSHAHQDPRHKAVRACVNVCWPQPTSCSTAKASRPSASTASCRRLGSPRPDLHRTRLQRLRTHHGQRRGTAAPSRALRTGADCGSGRCSRTWRWRLRSPMPTAWRRSYNCFTTARGFRPGWTRTRRQQRPPAGPRPRYSTRQQRMGEPPRPGRGAASPRSRRIKLTAIDDGPSRGPEPRHDG